MRKSKSQQCLTPCIEIPSILIRVFDSVRDIEWAHQLWSQSFQPKWALEMTELGSRLESATTVYVAEKNGTRIALCAVGYQGTQVAGLLLIMVEPRSQRQGVGTKLLKHVEKTLTASGVQELTLGFGSAGEYFWPGAPVDHSSAWPFFRKNGWPEHERSFDLIRGLEHYSTPLWVNERVAKADITLRLAHAKDSRALMRFEEAHFPVWASFFQSTVQEERHRNILLAQRHDGSIVGTLLLQADEPVLWSRDLGVCFGSLSVLGVAPEQQGRGAGIALASRAMEIIKERGGSGCYIQWTGLVDWYGKLGIEVWSAYRMSSKRLPPLGGTL